MHKVFCVFKVDSIPLKRVAKTYQHCILEVLFSVFIDIHDC